MARSFMIDVFRQNKQYHWMLSFDTDVIPNDGVNSEVGGGNMTLDRMVTMLEECRELGYDVVAGATVERSRLVPMVWTKPEIGATINDHDPFPIDQFAGGFFAVSRRGADKLRVLTEFETATGKVPLFCTNDAKGGEDITLSRNFATSGIKMACHPEFMMGHGTTFYQFPMKGTWQIMREAAQRELQARRERLGLTEGANADGGDHD